MKTLESELKELKSISSVTSNPKDKYDIDFNHTFALLTFQNRFSPELCLRLIKCLEKAIEQRNIEVRTSRSNPTNVYLHKYNQELLSILEGK